MSRLKKSLSLLLALVMAMSCMSMSAFAAGDGTGYDGATLPAGPNMTGAVIDVTAANAQYVLDGAYGKIDGKTINFTENVNDVLELARATKFKDSETTYYNYVNYQLQSNPTAWSENISSVMNSYSHYHRTLSNVTFTANDNVTLAGFTYTIAHQYDSGYDYVRDIAVGNGASYYKHTSLENIKFDGLDINGSVYMIGDAGYGEITGITFKDCSITSNGNAVNFNNNGNYSYGAITFTNCKINADKAGIIVNGFGNTVSITNNYIVAGSNNALQIAAKVEGVGTVSITGNYLKSDKYTVNLNNCTNEQITFTGNAVVAGSRGHLGHYKGDASGNFWAEASAVPDAEGKMMSSRTEPIADTGAGVGENEITCSSSYDTAVVDTTAAQWVTLSNAATAPIWTGSGTSANDPYLIDSAEKLAALATYVNEGNETANKYWKLDADINLKGENWEPIGKGYYNSKLEGNYRNDSKPFEGTFDGNGKHIDGLKVSTNGVATEKGKDKETDVTVGWAAGLFGMIKGGTVKNLNICKVEVSSATRFAGAVAGGLDGGTIYNCLVTSNPVSSHNTEHLFAISGKHFVGGIVGWTNGGTIENCTVGCYTHGTISAYDPSGEDGDDVGGIVGYINTNAKVINCDVPGEYVTVQGQRQVGGIVGMNNGGSVDANSISFAQVTNTAVASIDGKYYFPTLQAAFDAATDGKTVKLESNVTLTDRVSINGTMKAPVNKTVTLDMNDKKIDGTGRLTLAGGSLNIGGTGTISTTEPGLAPVEVRYSAEPSTKRTLVIGENVTLDGSASGYGLNIFGSNSDALNKIDVTVNGKVKSVIFVLGNLKNTANEINITVNGTVDSPKTGIALNGYANVTVSDGASVTGTTGIEVRAGKLTVGAATITATAKPAKVTANGSGTTTDGAAIAVAQHTTLLPIDVKINGATLKGYTGLAVSNPQGNKDNEPKSVTVSNTTVNPTNGGTKKLSFIAKADGKGVETRYGVTWAGLETSMISVPEGYALSAANPWQLSAKIVSEEGVAYTTLEDAIAAAVTTEEAAQNQSETATTITVNEATTLATAVENEVIQIAQNSAITVASTVSNDTATAKVLEIKNNSETTKVISVKSGNKTIAIPQAKITTTADTAFNYDDVAKAIVNAAAETTALNATDVTAFSVKMKQDEASVNPASSQTALMDAVNNSNKIGEPVRVYPEVTITTTVSGTTSSYTYNASAESANKIYHTTIDVDPDYNGQTITVLHISDDGKNLIEEIENVEVSNGKAVVEHHGCSYLLGVAQQQSGRAGFVWSVQGFAQDSLKFRFDLDIERSDVKTVRFSIQNYKNPGNSFVLDYPVSVTTKTQMKFDVPVYAYLANVPVVVELLDSNGNRLPIGNYWSDKAAEPEETFERSFIQFLDNTTSKQMPQIYTELRAYVIKAIAVWGDTRYYSEDGTKLN